MTDVLSSAEIGRKVIAKRVRALMRQQATLRAELRQTTGTIRYLTLGWTAEEIAATKKDSVHGD